MVSERSRFPTSRPGTQCRAGRQNTRNDKDLNRSRPQAFPDRAGNAQTQQRRDFPGFPVSPLYRERVSIGNAHPPRLQWLAGHGNDAPARRHGSFLAEKPCGGRERGASPPSECKPGFARFAVCRPHPWGLPLRGQPAAVQIRSRRICALPDPHQARPRSSVGGLSISRFRS